MEEEGMLTSFTLKYAFLLMHVVVRSGSTPLHRLSGGGRRRLWPRATSPGVPTEADEDEVAAPPRIATCLLDSPRIISHTILSQGVRL